MDEERLDRLRAEVFLAACDARRKAKDVVGVLEGMLQSLDCLIEKGEMPPSGCDDFYGWLDNASFDQLVHHLRHWVGEYKEKQAVLKSHGEKMDWEVQAKIRRERYEQQYLPETQEADTEG